MTAPRSVRLLLIAEAANPEWVSVPLVGWSMARALAARHQAHIVTQLRNREAFLRAGLIEGQEFTAIDTEAIDGRVWRMAKALRLGEKGAWQALTALSSLTYRYFERQVWRRFGPQIEAGAFDIVHRITPLTPTAVSTLAPRCRQAGVGFVLGPLNGGAPWPKGFAGAQRREREFLMPLRQAYKLQPGYRAMLAASDLILCGSRDTQGDIPAAYQGKTRLMAENGIDLARFPEPPPRVPSQVLRACFVGRLVPYKGCDMVLEAALPYLATGQMVLDIAGTGPEEQRLRDYVAAQGLGAAVRFHGWVDHRKVREIFAGADLFTFPSIREFGGGVVLEAMACRCVPVVADHAGPSELVDAAVGYKLPVSGGRAGLIEALRAQIGAVLADRARLTQQAETGYRRVLEQYTWQAKAETITRLYAEALPRLF
ncbi:Glycosyltransferase involved in cell wall bisynthesis [Gemmobacter aquatilis]|uniref:Glycosyltransferase involved in cell wall bisynthesis n=1 Tax=Gemmobacter aquatilis TaxID=933059 RepID=A0A1H7ZA42_9RHOB|nr:glycosyltransferase family 4 protein [Gemmobacter aquatilis]SEM55280.1 Glycosyltransferase involved in cell wall bisynthesis [Gemmobacter aquatilis]